MRDDDTAPPAPLTASAIAATLLGALSLIIASLAFEPGWVLGLLAAIVSGLIALTKSPLVSDSSASWRRRRNLGDSRGTAS